MSRKKKKGDDINPNAWLDTYADTITLLLTFFILLYSMSSIDSKKLSELSDALQKSLKGDIKVEELSDINEIATNDKENIEQTQEDLVKKLNKTIEANSFTDVIKVREEDRGVVLQLDETILFDPGKADLKKKSQNVLNMVTKIVKDLPNDVLIEGNTDDIPMFNKEFQSNWELSTARAVSVVKYFVSVKKLDPTRFAVKGYGEYKPLVENNSTKNRTINRRVDILIVKEQQKEK
ncbi:flagellar motor protein MotB [Terrisporobacter mayombei]|uniref:Motility protein B n=1 Tax=Terrisporobacter mayombei TaxID=1541 RepID=A0ABY9Q6F7_9FIRM|nr:OmpA family protein [Terrisporobacter mayombei]MCC3869490.1 OmpA family protein [Terrisporobacter mayombei]WMT83573.1 Motility protein B [Terrisporobacter mayombei]